MLNTVLIVPKLNPNTPTLMDGEVRLFKRKHSKVWQIAFTLDGRQVRVSSKKRIVNDAVAAAREIYLDYRFRQKNGLPVISMSSPQFLYHKFLVSLIRFQEQAVAYQARGVA